MSEEVSKIVQNKWEAKYDKKIVQLFFRQRSGNQLDSIELPIADFPDLYFLISGLAQLHPEWLNTQ